MSWNQLRSIEANPLFEVESYTVNHGYLENMTSKQVTTELANSKATIESQLNKTCDYLDYPFGSYSEEVTRQASSYFKIAFAVNFFIKMQQQPILFHASELAKI